MSRGSYVNLLRPGLPLARQYSATPYPQRLLTRRTYGLQMQTVVANRCTAPRSVWPEERWWTAFG